jgi:hypothetical protein
LQKANITAYYAANAPSLPRDIGAWGYNQGYRGSANMPPNGSTMAAPRRAGGRHKLGHTGRATKPQLLTRDQLDGRTNAAKVFDRLVADIEGDLGGREQLTTIERALVEGFAGAALSLYHLNTQLALGQNIDLSQHAQAVSAMVRVASRLGVSRRARDLTPSVNDYVDHINAQEAAE